MTCTKSLIKILLIMPLTLLLLADSAGAASAVYGKPVPKSSARIVGKTDPEISSEFKVHSTQITRWKQELLENAAELFSKGKKQAVNHEAEVAELHRQIGKLKVENDFLARLPGLNLTGRRSSR